MDALDIKTLVKIYAGGVHALKGVDLTVRRGDFFGLIGANGAGKTTMIGIITGLVNKTSGRVEVFGHDIDRDFAAARRLIGVVPQEFNFNQFERVRDILVTQAGYFGIEAARAASRVDHLLEKMDLWDKRNDISRFLSGGMKRRLMIARAMVHDPKLLILDEPTAGVDVELRHEMWDYLRELNEGGLTILLTTHYLEEVEQMCREAAIIKNGEIIKRDRVARLLQLLEEETYVVTVEKIVGLSQLARFRPQVVEDGVLEVELRRNDLHDFMLEITKAGMTITDLRAKGHRLEKLFLNILKT